MEVFAVEKKIPIQNYIILALVVLITVIAVFYARIWYKETRNYDDKNSVMLDVVSTINQDELSNYILENPNFILYLSFGQDRNIKDFEKKFKKLIVKKALTQNMLYLNTNNTDSDRLISYLKSLAKDDKIKDEIIDNSSVSIYIFENSQIKYVIFNAEDFSIKQINLLLQKYGMIENE